MTLNQIDEYCKSLPGCVVRYPFDSNPDLRAWCVGKKMFAWTVVSSSPEMVQLKADPELVPDLIANYPFVQPGYHMNKRHWLSVEASHCPQEMIQSLLEDAHSLFSVEASHCPQEMIQSLLEDAHSLVAMSFSRAERIRLLGD